MVVLMNSRGRLALQVVLTAIVVAGLAVDAYVHFHLASAFEQVRTSTLSQADLFRVEATLAVIAAVALLVRPRRYTAAFAFLVAAAGTVAVVLYRYVDVGKIGPIPNMYDPYWAPAEKTLSVFAEALAALAALGLFVMFHIRKQSAQQPPADGVYSVGSDRAG
jgi:phosphatidylglycerophosphatase A